MQNEHLTKFRVGVIGYSAQSFNENQARNFLLDAFHTIKKTEGRNVEVVSGLTWMGIPGLAYEIATALNWDTVGIACPKAFDYECFPCDRVIIAGKYWGDESDAFLNSIDVLIKVGGGKQSAAEAKAARDRGVIVIEYALDAFQVAA